MGVRKYNVKKRYDFVNGTAKTTSRNKTIHLIRRFLNRHGINVSQNDLDKIKHQILWGQAEKLDNHGKYIVTCQGKRIVVCTEKNRDNLELCTTYSIESYEKHQEIKKAKKESLITEYPKEPEEPNEYNYYSYVDEDKEERRKRHLNQKRKVKKKSEKNTNKIKQYNKNRTIEIQEKGNFNVFTRLSDKMVYLYTFVYSRLIYLEYKLEKESGGVKSKNGNRN